MKELQKKIEPGIVGDDRFFTVCEGHAVPSPYCAGVTCIGCMSFTRLSIGDSLRGSSFVKRVESVDFSEIIQRLSIPEEFKPQVLERIKDWDGFSYGRGSMYGGSVAVARSFTKGELFTAGAPGYGSWPDRFYQVG
jgi:hypothetical protein